MREIPETKVCRSCLERKPARAFREYPALVDGLYSYCKKCEERLRAGWDRNLARQDAIDEGGRLTVRATDEITKAFEEIASGNRRLERVILKALGGGKAEPASSTKPKSDDGDDEDPKKADSPKKRGRRAKGKDADDGKKGGRRKKRGPTKEDAQDAMRRLCEWYESEEGEDLLAEFKAKSVSDLDPEDYAEFVKRCEELVEEAQAEDDD